MGLIVVFNTTESSVPVDEEGHVCEPHSWAVADEDHAKEALLSGRLLICNVEGLKEEDSNPAVIMAKKELEERARQSKPPKPTPKAEPAEAAPPVDEKK